MIKLLEQSNILHSILQEEDIVAAANKARASKVHQRLLARKEARVAGQTAKKGVQSFKGSMKPVKGLGKTPSKLHQRIQAHKTMRQVAKVDKIMGTGPKPMGPALKPPTAVSAPKPAIKAPVSSVTKVAPKGTPKWNLNKTPSPKGPMGPKNNVFNLDKPKMGPAAPTGTDTADKASKIHQAADWVGGHKLATAGIAAGTALAGYGAYKGIKHLMKKSAAKKAASSSQN